jgi:hypothetical protein
MSLNALRSILLIDDDEPSSSAELAEGERDEEPDDGDQASEVGGGFEGFGDHRVGEHREDRAGGRRMRRWHVACQASR